MLPDPFDKGSMPPLAHALLETGRLSGRLQVYQEVNQTLAAILRANQEGADFNVVTELVTHMGEGLADTVRAQQESYSKLQQSLRGQDDS